MALDVHSPDRSRLYHFKLDRILGEGGTGRVYRGIDMNKGVVVAIKLFRENFFRNQLHVRELAKGVKRFRKYKHPNVVEIYDFIEGPEGHCMVMEYVDGPDLKWYLANRPWNLQERLIISAQICNGLQYLHDQGSVHHDFKPSNVLFTRKGMAKVADFSLYGGGFLLERVFGGVGEQITPMFVAPEVIEKKKAGPAGDQYSFGITMYMLFTDRVPFVVDSLQKLYHCHLRVTPEHPTIVNSKCPRQLGDIIMKLLAKDPKGRFADMDQVRIAFADIGASRI
jgi:eukaryotic-like serine/threonine-protein kinase